VSYEPQQKGENAMKRMGIVLLGVVCLISPYAFSNTSEIDCEIIHCKKIEKEEGSETFKAPKIEWDAVKSIPQKYQKVNYKIGYLLYITQNKAIM